MIARSNVTCAAGDCAIAKGVCNFDDDTQAMQLKMLRPPKAKT